MTTGVSSGLRAKRASCALTVYSGRCSAHMTCSRGTDADLGQTVRAHIAAGIDDDVEFGPFDQPLVSGERSPSLSRRQSRAHPPSPSGA
jgi:hypothetical protein